jgi:type II secretion system protein H
LIELLVVLAILGIAAGLAVVSLGADERRAPEREARRLAGALEHAAAAAQWRGETLGVSAEGAAYRFWRRGQDERWWPVADDDVLAPRPLARGLTVGVVAYAGAPVPPDAILPLRPSGRNEPYVLAVASADSLLLVAADPLNRVRVSPAPSTP